MAVKPNTPWAISVIQPRACANHGKIAVKPYRLTTYSATPKPMPAKGAGMVSRRAVSNASNTAQVMEITKWISVAISMTPAPNVAGGSNTDRPRTIAAVSRASRYRMPGKSSVKISQSSISIRVDAMPAITPAQSMARQPDSQFMRSLSISFLFTMKTSIAWQQCRRDDQSYRLCLACLNNVTRFHSITHYFDFFLSQVESSITMTIAANTSVAITHTRLAILILLDDWDRDYADHVRTFTAIKTLRHEFSRYAQNRNSSVRQHTDCRYSKCGCARSL